jgi:hypothetical protein
MCWKCWWRAGSAHLCNRGGLAFGGLVGPELKLGAYDPRRAPMPRFVIQETFTRTSTATGGVPDG